VPKPTRPQRRGAAFFIRRADGFILVRTRPPKGLLGGMTEIPGTEWSTDFDLADALSQAPLPAAYRRARAPVTHVFTHFALELAVFRTEVAAQTPAPALCRWVAEDALDREALPSLMRKVVDVARAAAQT
jgi:A/G-specific adenine glycosylase